MQKIHHTIHINAPREKVWDTMLNKDTYQVWTKPFNPTSSFEGTWEQGTDMKFIGVDENGQNMGGMYSRVKENRPHEFISIEHLGMITDGVIDTTSEEVKKWTPAFENYTFTPVEGGTEVSIELDSPDEYAPMFEEMWPKALQILKELAEKE